MGFADYWCFVREDNERRTVLPAFGVVAIALLIGFYAALSDWATHLMLEPPTLVFAASFLFVLWTFIGELVLRDRMWPRSVRIAHDYAYSIITAPLQVPTSKHSAK